MNLSEAFKALDSTEAAKPTAEQVQARITEAQAHSAARTAELIAGNGGGIKTVSAADLLEKDIPPLVYVVENMIADFDLTIVASRPKVGKSWFVLQIAIAVVMGRPLFNRYATAQGPVLFFGLEDNDRRMQSRIRAIMMGESLTNAKQLEISYELKLDDAGYVMLESKLASMRPRLVVIDIFATAAPGRKRSNNVYQDDYAEIHRLRKLAQKHKVAIVLVFHTRKEPPNGNLSGMALDEIMGTSGITGAADTLIVFRRNAEKLPVLNIVGKDVPETDGLVLRLDVASGGWSIVGSAEYVGSKARTEIIAALATGPLSMPEIARKIGKKPDTVKKLLREMRDDGEIYSLGGKYCLRIPSHDPRLPI